MDADITCILAAEVPASLLQVFPASLTRKFPAFPSLLLLRADCQFFRLGIGLKDLIHGNVFNEEMHYNSKSAQMILKSNTKSW
ncbi:hypothetical protein [Mesobacillus jeotgali]|jgi:hypothetical protein|uniref:Uncharacterized protein n=1 Tax=Mesobacillus jeotgali TaxID=129985 RepID=A0ABY9VEI2_9BACI|nr:hypothetical protein [Mesobacillus jeotgali]WNF22125.1 hypothetical protein RH061_18340 [Mesobacillus jeotgali]